MAVAVAVAAATALLAPGAARAAAGSTPDIRVDLARGEGAINRGLIGFDYHPGHVPLAAVAALHPRFVRIDASLESASPARGVLKLDHLLSVVREVRSIGAEPMVILSYTPAWLGASAVPTDPTRNPPNDLTAWQSLVESVARRLAGAPQRVRWFEAWNEPDLPTYWTGTPAQWGEMAAASARGVAAVAARTGLPLRFGGPASFFPDPVYEAQFLASMRSAGVPAGFVSWHYYGNYPCIGPDGPETPGPPGTVESLVLGCANPAADPGFFDRGVTVERAGASSAAPGAPLILDEWNLSAGGLDHRMTTHEGAAFDAATLIDLQEARVSDAVFYQATDTDPRPGGWGAVSYAGYRRPAWWTFDLWRALGRVRVALTGDERARGLWAIASRGPDRRRVTVLLANWSASAPAQRRVTLSLSGLPNGTAVRSASRRCIDSSHGGAGPGRAVSVGRDGSVALTLPAQSATLLTVRLGRTR